MTRFGAIVCFTLAGAEQAERFLSASRLLNSATSFGGVHSSAERRARWGGDDVAEGFIRLSVGCEDPEDVIADVEQALAAAAAR
jgi:cystathionine gamma-lyase